MLHAAATHLCINLKEAWCGFGLFGRHSYTTVLVMKALNISGIGNGQNPVLIGNAVQWSHMYEKALIWQGSYLTSLSPSSLNFLTKMAPIVSVEPSKPTISVRSRGP